MAGIYAADGSMNVTVVDGSTRTGLMAADGSINVVVSTGSSFIGAYHACGAWNVTPVTTGIVTARAADGSLNVCTTPYAATGATRVTAVSGSLSGVILGDLTKWQTARAKVLNSTADAKVLVLGESTARGVGAGTSGALLNVGCDIGAWPTQLAPYLTTRGLPAAHDGIVGMGFGSNGTDSRVVLNTDWHADGNASIGGPAYRNITALSVAPLSFTPVDAFDNIEICYMTLTNNGSFSYNVDGGSALNTVATGSPNNGLSLTTATVTLGTHTLNIVPTTISSGLQIVWIRTWDSTHKRAQIYNAGRSGAHIGDIVNNSGGNRSALSAITKFAPDLTICLIGANDQVDQTVQATFQTNLQTLIDTAKVSGSVVLGSTTPFLDNTLGEAGRIQYGDWIKATAASNNVSYLDIVRGVGTYANALANNWMTTASLSSTLHMNATGYAQVLPFVNTVMRA